MTDTPNDGTPTADQPSPDHWADDAHRYRLESRIATGGMGQVWRGRDERLGRPVAVKLLKTEYADDASFRQRFSQEAQHAAALHHPGVASVYDFGEAASTDGSGTPRPYLVMELVDGKPLSDLIRAGHPMDPEVTRDLMAQAAEAVAAAHRAGIVHRDLKPANMLITPDRRVKITDFGIARAGEGMALTQTGQVMGTPQYLSPEQAQGKPATPASDVYSLGVVAFECLASHRPFVGETPVATALAHLREPVPDLPESVPAPLAAVVARALAKDPAERYADADALATALRSPEDAVLLAGPAATQVLTADAPVVAPVVPPRGPSTVASPAPPPGERRRRRLPPWPWLLLGLVVLIGLIVVAVLLAGNDTTEAPQDSPTKAVKTPRASTTPSTTPSTPSAPTSSAPTAPTKSAGPAEVQVDESDYVGRDEKDVESELRDLGLKVTKDKLDNDGTHEEDTVEGVDPSGTLHEGDEITVSYWDKVKGPPPPSESSSDGTQ